MIKTVEKYIISCITLNDAHINLDRLYRRISSIISINNNKDENEKFKQFYFTMKEDNKRSIMDLIMMLNYIRKYVKERGGFVTEYWIESNLTIYHKIKDFIDYKNKDYNDEIIFNKKSVIISFENGGMSMNYKDIIRIIFTKNDIKGSD